MIELGKPEPARWSRPVPKGFHENRKGRLVKNKKPISVRRARQVRYSRKYRDKQFAAGNCEACGKPRGESPYPRFCRKHGIRDRLTHRKSRGEKPWKRGGRGRPPKDVPVRDLTQLEEMKL